MSLVLEAHELHYTIDDLTTILDAWRKFKMPATDEDFEYIENVRNKGYITDEQKVTIRLIVVYTTINGSPSILHTMYRDSIEHMKDILVAHNFRQKVSA